MIMADTATALQTRRAVKSRKPHFVRTDVHKLKRLASKWRKPGGWQNKMRLQKRGKRRLVSAGWGSPRDVQGLSRNGMVFAPVVSPADLAGLDARKHLLVMSAALGAKKKLVLLAKAKEAGFSVFNAKDIDQSIAALHQKRDARKARSDAAKERVAARHAKSQKASAKKSKAAKDTAKEDAARTDAKEDPAEADAAKNSRPQEKKPQQENAAAASAFASATPAPETDDAAGVKKSATAAKTDVAAKTDAAVHADDVKATVGDAPAGAPVVSEEKKKNSKDTDQNHAESDRKD